MNCPENARNRNSKLLLTELSPVLKFCLCGMTLPQTPGLPHGGFRDLERLPLPRHPYQRAQKPIT